MEISTKIYGISTNKIKAERIVIQKEGNIIVMYLDGKFSMTAPKSCKIGIVVEECPG